MGITIDRLCKRYAEKIIFDDFSLTLSDGAYCLYGPSGSGKTTLIRLLCGLESVDSGTISGVNDQKISAVFQEDRLIESLSAEKNVLLTAKNGFTRTDARALLKRLGISEPQKRTAEFSGGMKRCCAIARALAADYELLLLDEPLTGLDEAARRSVLQVIFEENHFRTVICATHFRDFEEYFSAETIHIPTIQAAD